MVELARDKNGVARDALHGALHPTLVAVGEAACQGRVIESPASATLLVAQDTRPADVSVLVCQPIQTHQHLPRHIAIEGIGQRRIQVISRIEIVRSLSLRAAVVRIVLGIIESGGIAMLAHSGSIRALIDDAVSREAQVQKPLSLRHLVRALQGSRNDALRNQLVVDVLSHYLEAVGRRMEVARQHIEPPIIAEGNRGAVYVVLAELLRDILYAGICIRLRPSLTILLCDTLASRQDAQADHLRLRIPRRELPQKTLVSATEGDRVLEVLRPVLTQRHLRRIPVVRTASNEDEVRVASPAKRLHAMVTQERRITVEHVASHTAAAPRSICQER